MTTDPELSRIPWRPIEPLDSASASTNGSFAALDALREEWQRILAPLDEKERRKIRERTLRRLAIETGIIERLYDVDWGLTLSLVAEGFFKDTIERAGGGVDDRTLATLRAQRDGLDLVSDVLRGDRAFSPSFVKDLHAMITRAQEFYTARDAAGRPFDRPLAHGQYKMLPNHVARSDGSLLEYCPPEHVASEMERLVALFDDLEHTSVNPIVKAAWLHHRFVQIHPFEDGNGRVARALTVLVLEKHAFAPLVVDRWHREEYIAALDQANGGNIGPLVGLFVQLERAALASELERPPETIALGESSDVARTLAAQLAAIRRRQESQVQQELRIRAVAVMGRVRNWFDHKREEIRAAFGDQGIFDVQILANTELPGDSDRLYWYRREINLSAGRAGHYADYSFYSAWAALRVRIRPLELRFVTSLHGAGKRAGVMAVTTVARIVTVDDSENDAADTTIITTNDAFTFVHTESLDEIDARAPELEALLERGLSVALSRLMQDVVGEARAD